jgi:N-methylhydantoinase B
MEIITKPGTVLDPVYPATTAGQCVTLGQEVTECVELALGQVVPYDTPALWARHVNPLYAGKRRDIIDPRTGAIAEYTAHTFHAIGSSGAAWGYDAVDGNGSVPVAGAQIRAPIEVEEWDIPYRWLKYEFLTDSSGAGRWRGGLGTHVQALNVYNKDVWKPLDCLTMSGNADGERFGSVGLLGGKGGTLTKLEIIRDGEHLPYRTMDLQYVQPGDIIVSYSGGGGGVGDPLDRETEKVRWDVLNEYMSLEAAQDVYGVVIDPDSLEVDEEATKELREKMRGGQ